MDFWNSIDFNKRPTLTSRPTTETTTVFVKRTFRRNSRGCCSILSSASGELQSVGIYTITKKKHWYFSRSLLTYTEPSSKWISRQYVKQKKWLQNLKRLDHESQTIRKKSAPIMEFAWFDLSVWLRNWDAKPLDLGRGNLIEEIPIFLVHQNIQWKQIMIAIID